MEQQPTHILRVTAGDIRKAEGFTEPNKCILSNAANRQLPHETNEIWTESVTKLALRERLGEDDWGPHEKKNLYHRVFDSIEYDQLMSRYLNSEEPEKHIVLEIPLYEQELESY